MESWAIYSQIWSKALLIFLHEWNRNIESCCTGFRTGEWCASFHPTGSTCTLHEARRCHAPRTTCTRIGSDPIPKGGHCCRGSLSLHGSAPPDHHWSKHERCFRQRDVLCSHFDWCDLKLLFWGKNAKAKHFLCLFLMWGTFTYLLAPHTSAGPTSRCSVDPAASFRS